MLKQVGHTVSPASKTLKILFFKWLKPVPLQELRYAKRLAHLSEKKSNTKALNVVRGK
jgi:hypothetical protein